MRKRRGPRAALQTAAALIWFGAPAAGMADPGSACCGDLEARVEQLEAMVARKGNRKVAVEVSGVINQALLGWYDGAESNAYAVTNDNARSRLRFVGGADVTPDWQVGYRLEVGIRSANSKLVNQLGRPDRGDGRPDIRETVWFFKSKRNGTLFIGTTFPSFTNIADSNVTQTDWFAKYGAIEDTGLSMFLRSGRTGGLSRTLTWRRIVGAGGDQPGETQRGFQLIKYVSPTWNGLTAAATLVADDFWDATLRYQGEIAGFEVAAGIGYLDLVPGSRSLGVCALNRFVTSGDDASKCREVSGSVSVRHEATGLFLNLGAGLTIEGVLEDTARFAGTGVDDGELFWSGQVGIEKRVQRAGADDDLRRALSLRRRRGDRDSGSCRRPAQPDGARHLDGVAVGHGRDRRRIGAGHRCGGGDRLSVLPARVGRPDAAPAQRPGGDGADRGGADRRSRSSADGCRDQVLRRDASRASPATRTRPRTTGVSRHTSSSAGTASAISGNSVKSRVNAISASMRAS